MSITPAGPHPYRTTILADRLRAYLDHHDFARILAHKNYPSGRREVVVTTALPWRWLAILAARSDGQVTRSDRTGRYRTDWWIRIR